MQKYINIVVTVQEEQYDLVSAAVCEREVIGITEGLDELTLCFSAPESPEKFVAEVLADVRAFGVEITSSTFELVEQRNWNEEWEQSLQPAWITDNIVVVPEHLAETVTAEHKIIVTPKMSFGTGHHQTTALVLQLLQELVKPGQHWIDAGTGTGVLAIGAILFGAETVYAFDFDEWSVNNTLENLRLNGVEPHSCLVEKADVFTVNLPQTDGIVANLHRHVILPNLPKFYEALRPKNPLIVSGLLKYDVDEVVSAAQAVGFEHCQTRLEGEWAAIFFEKPNQ